MHYSTSEISIARNIMKQINIYTYVINCIRSVSVEAYQRKKQNASFIEQPEEEKFC